MLNPNQFHVNEAWVAFKLNESPIKTERDGAFNCIGLMDAGSCFMLTFVFISERSSEPTAEESKVLLEKGRALKNELPKTLFILKTERLPLLSAEAERQGITVVHISPDQATAFISEARDSFKKNLGGRMSQ